VEVNRHHQMLQMWIQNELNAVNSVVRLDCLVVVGVHDCLMSNDCDVVIVCMVTAAAVALAMVEG